jgi:hypothetical protein
MHEKMLGIFQKNKQDKTKAKQTNKNLPPESKNLSIGRGQIFCLSKREQKASF